MMTPAHVRRRGAAAILVVLLLAGAACSADGGGPRADPASTTPSETTTESTASADAGASEPTPTPVPQGVTCLPVDNATAADIASKSIDPISPVPGRTVAHRPLGLRGTYLVVMVFTGPGRPEPQTGVWAIKRSIEPDEHGAISSVDRIARYVTSWPVARGVVEDDFRVSEVRACTLV